jgi:hypothetical protein
VVFALVGAPTAFAAAPWDGGLAVVSPLEAHAGVIATKIAGRPAQVACNSPEEWAAFTKDITGGVLLGYVPWEWDPARGDWYPSDVAQINPLVCQALDVFWQAPDKRAITMRCHTSDELVKVSRKIRYRAKVKGRWVWKTKWKTHTEPRPVYGECRDLKLFLASIDTLAHEPVHISGVSDEGVTECYAIQHFADVAEHFGASSELARELSANYWTRFYPTRGTDYYRPDCQNGSPLDLNPASDVWP